MNTALQDARWEDNDCPWCRAPRSGAELRHKKAGSAYWRCQQCSLVYLSPRLHFDDMRRFYEDGAYWQGDNALGYDDYEGEVEHQAKTFARRVAYLERFATKGRLLDVGAGPGGLVRAALDKGWDAHGVDLCAPPGDSQAELKGRLHQGTLDTVFTESEGFDAIVMLDFIEHVYDLQETVKRLHVLTRPGGTLLIATPNYDALMRRVLGDRSVSLKVPEHVVYFCRKTLERTLAPWFRLTHVRPTGQSCSVEFVRRRLSDVLPGIGAIIGSFSLPAPVARASIRVPSGSMLAVAQREDAPLRRGRHIPPIHGRL